jgi:response regulator RpfG family c-di-GMP phosphodiesterase
MSFPLHNKFGIFPIYINVIIYKVMTTNKSKRSNIFLPIWRTVGIYLIFSSLWIIFSDYLLYFVTDELDVFLRLQNFKGLFFVIASGALLFGLLWHEIQKRENEWFRHQQEQEILLQQVQQANQELLAARDATIEGWARTLAFADIETSHHSGRAINLTLKVAEQMNISQDQAQFIHWGVLLHDIGKLGIPEAIMHKPGPLTPQEREIINQHPVMGYELLKTVTYLAPILDIPHYHHERWDGSGYPEGLQGETIPLMARIFAVVDVWDAMISDRPYRKALPESEAMSYITAQSGRHFDPAVVEAFLQVKP